MGNETSTPSTGSPAATIAHINCGSAGQGHDTNDLVSLSGKTQAASFPSIEITGPRADFISFGRSHRWSAADFTYTVQVPVPGEYDVTLVFAETYEGAFAPGRRVFDASVSGTKSFEFNNIDVFSQAGAHAVYEIGVQNVPAEGEIRIHLRKGAAENPFISGIVVGAVENAREPAERPTIPPLATTVTKEQYDNCIQKIDAYVAEAKATAPTGVRDVPQFMFHAPGTPVRGLIMTFHGFSGTHYDHRILARYLYDQGYDVFHSMLAGHMYDGNHWPETLLADEYGGATVKQTIAQDAELMQMLAQSRNNVAIIPALLDRLREKNPDFERVMSAQAYMSALDDDEDANFSQFFASEHRRYATEGSAQLALLDAHPGPVHVTGLSVGGTAALAVAALRPDRVSRCIAMAPLLEIWEPFPNTQRSLVNYVGPLGVAPDFAWDPATPFAVAAFTAAGRLGGSLTASRKFQQVFASGRVQLYMILTEDEDAADIPTNKRFFEDCGGRAAGNYLFTYPKSYKVPHPLLDPTARSRGLRNAFYQPLYQTCYSFFAAGYVESALLLRNEVDRGLPIPPKAEHGLHGPSGFYGKAAQTGRHTPDN